MIKTTLSLLETAISQVLENESIDYEDEQYLQDTQAVGRFLVAQEDYYLIDLGCLSPLKITDDQKRMVMDYIESNQDNLGKFYDDFAIYLSYFAA